MTNIALDRITLDAGTQSRAQLSMDLIDEYAQAMREGARFPDVWLVHDGQNYFLADGFHRYYAARQAGWSEINASVVQGTLEDAIWQSFSVNAAHGLRRSNEDKQRAVLGALKHLKSAGLSNREIARHCKVDESTVRDYRNKLEATAGIPQSTIRTGGDGRTINTANIGLTAHWGFNDGPTFWKAVEKLDLDPRDVLERIQPGAQRLTDLVMSREQAFQCLNELSIERLRSLFPVDSFVRHMKPERLGRVIAHQAESLRVYDLTHELEDQWMVSHLRAASDEEVKASTGAVPTRPKPTRPEGISGEIAVGDLVWLPAGEEKRVGRIDEKRKYAMMVSGAGWHYLNSLVRLEAAPVAEDQTTEEQAAEDHLIAEQVSSDEGDDPYDNGTLDDYPEGDHAHSDEQKQEQAIDLVNNFGAPGYTSKTEVYESIRRLHQRINLLEPGELRDQLEICIATMCGLFEGLVKMKEFESEGIS